MAKVTESGKSDKGGKSGGNRQLSHMTHLRFEADTWQGESYGWGLDFREFDCAAFVVHVGEVVSHPFRSSQWLFLAQGGGEGEGESSLMALESTGATDGFVPIPPTLMGTTVRLP